MLPKYCPALISFQTKLVNALTTYTEIASTSEVVTGGRDPRHRHKVKHWVHQWDSDKKGDKGGKGHGKGGESDDRE